MRQYVLLISFAGYCFQHVLPSENNRTYEVDLSQRVNISDLKISMEYFDGEWRVTSNNQVIVQGDTGYQASCALSSNSPIFCLSVRNNIRFSLLLEPLEAEHLHYRKFKISNRMSIQFGKDLSNVDVALQSAFISNVHARMTQQDGKWYIEDLSKNGLYLNDQRLPKERRVKLRQFDQLFTGGFHIVFLGECIAINHSDHVASRLEKYEASAETNSVPISEEHTAYLRSPRIQNPLPQDPIEIEAPPPKQFRKKQPLLFVIGPALTTPLPMLTTMIVRMNLSASGSLYWIMGISVVMSALIGLGWSLARKKYDEKDEKQTEEQRQIAYRSYLQKNEAVLKQRHDECRKLMLLQYPSSNEIREFLRQNNLTQFLWNRNIRSSDFSSVRLGIGDIVLPGDIQIPKSRFSVTNDDLAELPAEIKRQYRFVTHIPALACLKAHKMIGLVGDKKHIYELVCNMAVQSAALHSYTDLRMAFLYGEKEKSEFDWARWFPHTFSPDKSVRLMGDESESQQMILAFLSDVIRRRMNDRQEDQNTLQLPLYLVFCTQPELLYNHMIYRAVTDAADYGVVFVLAYGRIDLLPNECTYLIQSDENFSGCYALDKEIDETRSVAFEYLPSIQAEQIARSISGIWVNEIADGEMPERIDFLEMYEIADIHEWNLIKKWKENRAYESICGQIGVTYGRRPVYLDIHERQHGPHGLVAGTTGSGKSETIQTFVLSLMMNYHPNEVSFVLIDYKGGGMANLFAGTPHVAGTITNISASGGGEESESKTDTVQTQRALASLKSEIKRRQKIFNAYAVNHIDQYSRLHREGTAKEPVPHLIIISDEFAELKKEQPEFIKELVSTARVGRSLGVHLILATQKPSGVVDDEIWSNSRFKLCLKVQDRQDSLEMLHRPEASELSRTGQGYLQIGNDEVFELFQSGYSGAEYAPELTAQSQKNQIEVITLSGTRIRKKIQRDPAQKKCTQLDACVQYIRETAQAYGISDTRPLWLPMLPQKIAVEELLQSRKPDNTYTAVVGKLDYPEQQSQPLFLVRFPQCGHVLVIGNAGMGKSTLMKTVVYSLCCGQRAERFNWYALDFSNHSFDELRGMPHCGGIVYPEDEEKVKRIFQQLGELLQSRKKILADAGIVTAEDFRRMNKASMPLTLVLLDNYAGFIEQYEKYADVLLKLLREGISCGIHFMVSMNAASDMRSKWSQNFATTIPLVLNERADYYSYLGCTPQIVPAGNPGSGLYLHNGSVVQFQTAYVAAASRILAEIRRNADGYQAPQLRFIDRTQTYAEYLQTQTLDGDRLPLGWYANNITSYSISLWDTFCYFISDTAGLGAASMEANILHYAVEKQLECHFVADEGVDAPEAAKIHTYHSYDEMFSLMTYLRDVFKQRAADRKAYLAENDRYGCDTFIQSKYHPILVVFHDYNAFCTAAYANTSSSFIDAFEAFLKNGKKFGITFIAVWNKALYQQNIQKPACQLFLAQKSGVHLGGKLDTQRAIEVNMPYGEQSRQRAPEVGFALDASRVTEVFIPPHELRQEEL